jgi:hypothetical protein
LTKKKREIRFSADCQFKSTGNKSVLNDLISEMFVSFVNERSETGKTGKTIEKKIS